MPEQRDLRADRDVMRRSAEDAIDSLRDSVLTDAKLPSAALARNYWLSVRALCLMGIHAIERALVAEEALRLRALARGEDMADGSFTHCPWCKAEGCADARREAYYPDTPDFCASGWVQHLLTTARAKVLP